MLVDNDSRLLRMVADGGSMDNSAWPELLPKLTKRLEQIARTEFPIPKLPHPPRTSPPSSPPPQLQSQANQAPQDSQTSVAASSSSEITDKENAPPSASVSSDALTSVEIPDGTLPPQILALLTSITQNLESYFSTYPPHTIQRLSELVLTPKKHYRTLPTYLHAVDRVVHVTSGANIYPLPAAVPDAQGAKILSNGVSLTGAADPSSISWGNSTTAQASLGSDESLGGALLTPISWLRNPSAMNSNNHIKDMDGEVKTESTETIDGPNGAGSIETVSVSVNGVSSVTLASTPANTSSPPSNSDGHNVSSLRAEGGVTQGELLRQEQRAGVVPATQLSGGLIRSSLDGDDDEDDAPHARGPDEIGMEDMGPQAAGVGGVIHGMQGIDVEAAVGRRLEPESEPQPEGSNGDSSPQPTHGDVTPAKREAEDDIGGGESKRPKEDPDPEEAKQKSHKEDEDIELVDADGRTDDEPKVGERGENVGSDAVDTTTAA